MATSPASKLKLPARALQTRDAARYIGMSHAWLVESRSVRYQRLCLERPGHYAPPPKFFKVGPKRMLYLVTELDQWLRDRVEQGAQAS